MFGSIEMRGYVKSAPEKYSRIESSKVNIVITFEENKKNDSVVFSNATNQIKLKYLWHETDAEKIRICTNEGIFKIYI